MKIGKLYKTKKYKTPQYIMLLAMEAYKTFDGDELYSLLYLNKIKIDTIYGWSESDFLNFYEEVEK